MLAPVFANQKNFKEDFALMKKGKSKNRTEHVFCSELLETWCTTEQQEWPCQAPSPRAALSTWATNHRSFGLCEHLWFIWIGFVYPLATWGLRHQTTLRDWVLECPQIFPYKLIIIASSVYAISAHKRFHRCTLILGSRSNLYCWEET